MCGWLSIIWNSSGGREATYGVKFNSVCSIEIQSTGVSMHLTWVLTRTRIVEKLSNFHSTKFCEELKSSENMFPAVFQILFVAPTSGCSKLVFQAAIVAKKKDPVLASSLTLFDLGLISASSFNTPNSAASQTITCRFYLPLSLWIQTLRHYLLNAIGIRKQIIRCEKIKKLKKIVLILWD